ncbi:MAG TPA: hypothetical protein VGS20_02530 [Candidatus Acidoferrales bacterium]|nr:hypothetical protein [Candidatus Acidoferrales bacterium]
MFTRASRVLYPLAFAWLAASLPARLNSQGRRSAPMAAQAMRAAARPMKLDIRPASRAARVGDRVSVEIVLLGADNQKASWNRESLIVVEATGPTGKRQQYKVEIRPGQSSVQFAMQASEAGLYKLRARDTNNTLMPGGNAVLVSRPPAARQHARARRRSSSYAPAQEGRLLAVAARIGEPSPTTQAPGGGQGPAAPAGGAAAAELMVTNSSGKDDILADGKDFARIQVYYVDPQGGPAPADIKIWMHWLHGNFAPQPMIIHRGDSSAEGHWTSLTAVADTLSIALSAPSYPVAGDRDLEVSFVPAIYGIAPAAPNPLKLSLVDCEPLTAQFFDQQGRTVQTSKSRSVTFISSNPRLNVDPGSVDVAPGHSAATIFLLPTWSGTSKLDVWTPGYDHQSIVVQVTMGLVLLLCLSGGVIGGIAAKETLKGTLVGRIFVGILGAIVLVWICVYAVLPRTHSIIAHNLVSVFVVGIVGGYGGTQVLDFAGKKLGWL